MYNQGMCAVTRGGVGVWNVPLVPWLYMILLIPFFPPFFLYLT